MRQYIPYIISAIALLFSAYQFVKNTEKEDTSQITTVLIKLEGIASNVTEIKSDVKETRSDVQDLRERMALNEASVKSAHKRIDAMERKVIKDERISEV